MNFDILQSPLAFLHQEIGDIAHEETLRSYENSWEKDGKFISAAIDRNGTPWLRMFDPFGKRIDEILLPQEYWKLVKNGYKVGAVWRVFEEDSLLTSYLQGYITSFYDPGLYCPHTVSLATRSEGHTAELQAQAYLVCRLLLEKKKKNNNSSQGPVGVTVNARFVIAQAS